MSWELGAGSWSLEPELGAGSRELGAGSWSRSSELGAWTLELVAAFLDFLEFLKPANSKKSKNLNKFKNSNKSMDFHGFDCISIVFFGFPWF